MKGKNSSVKGSSSNWRVPNGMKDVLPGTGEFMSNVISNIAAVFSKWGYFQVMTPVLEYYENMVGSSGRESFMLIDREGEILMLRTEMTTPIARMVASRLGDAGFPQRLCYSSNVFRYNDVQMGLQRESFQSGVELIGDGSPAADGEIIALAVEALKKAGLNDFQISVNHVNFLRGIVDDIEIGEAEKNSILTAITSQDFVALEILLSSLAIPAETKQLIMSLPSWRGDVSLIDKALGLVSNPLSLSALENLKKVFTFLEAYGVTENIYLDLGVVRDFNYYTGIVFEVYSRGLGVPICGGGRYDHLLSAYGANQPATGFAIGIDRLMIALDEAGVVQKNTNVDYLVEGDDMPKAIYIATKLREQGHSVVVAARGSKVKANKVIDVADIGRY